jgi:hypothetical protein
MEPFLLIRISVEVAADVTRQWTILSLCLCHINIYLVSLFGVSNNVAKPVSLAVSIRPTANFIAFSFSWPHCSNMDFLLSFLWIRYWIWQNVWNNLSRGTSGSACCCYQKDSFLSCFIWGSKTNCNTQSLQSTAPLHNVLVNKIMCYLSFSCPTMNNRLFSHIFQIYLLQVFRMVKKHNIVSVRITWSGEQCFFRGIYC